MSVTRNQVTNHGEWNQFECVQFTKNIGNQLGFGGIDKDEVIRQVTLNCTERGHMLIQIREEIQMTIDAYKELYESVLANGIRKLLRREHKKSDLSIRAKQLTSENENLEIELAEIYLMTEKLERDAAEQRDAAIKRQAEELTSLKKSNQLIKIQLESIISPKRV